jgi:hypothetical protein
VLISRPGFGPLKPGCDRGRTGEPDGRAGGLDNRAGAGDRRGAARTHAEGDRLGKGERGGRRGELTTGSTDGSNHSPGSNLGQGERWKRGRGRLLRGKERMRGREHIRRGGPGRARRVWVGPRAGPTTLYSLSRASNRD